MKYTPVGLIQYDALLSRCQSLAELRPDFIPAFDSLLKAEDMELWEYWRRIRPERLEVRVLRPQTQLLIED